MKGEIPVPAQTITVGVEGSIGGLKAVPLALGTNFRGRCALMQSSIHALQIPFLTYPSGVLYSIVLKRNSMVCVRVSLELEME